MKAMYSCKEVSQFVSESLDRKLPFWTRVQLWMHLGMCGLCSRFRKTMIRVDQVVKQHAEQFEHDAKVGESKLSPEAREKIQRLLDANRQ